MALWIIIFSSILVFFTICLTYLIHKSCQVVPDLWAGTPIALWSNRRQRLMVLGAWVVVVVVIAISLELINAMVCVFYAAILWFSGDLLNRLCRLIFKRSFSQKTVALASVGLTILVLATGWYLDHHVWQKNYKITTAKNVDSLRIAMIADIHLGATFDAEGFKQHLATIEAQHPDLLAVVGDYVDDGTTKDEMIKATQYLGQFKTKLGIFYVEGNHDKAYYGAQRRGFSLEDLHQELAKNNITVLRDEVLNLNDQVYLIGRRDFSWEKEQRQTRVSMPELMGKIDPSKFVLVLDHQPTDFKAQAAAKADLILCGHTHGGQLFPFNKVGEWIKANDLVYGHKQIGDPEFIYQKQVFIMKPS